MISINKNNNTNGEHVYYSIIINCYDIHDTSSLNKILKIAY